MGPRIGSWRDCVLVGALAPLPALLALAVFGTLRTPDTAGYVAYAAQLLAHALPRGQALLLEGPAPISLFRTPGYPLLLAWLGRDASVVGLQIAVTAGLAVLGQRAAQRLGAARWAAVAAGLLPAIGFSVVLQLCILTDAFYGVLATGAALVLVLMEGGWGALLAGCMLAAAMLLREATLFLALFYMPLALCGRRRGAALLVLALPACIAAGLMGWNATRTGRPVLTTSRQTVMVQAVLPLLKRGLPIYDGNDAFDRAARATVAAGDAHQRGDYKQIDALHSLLFWRAHMTAPEIADAATARYWRAWRRFPGAMAAATLANLRPEFFSMPFQPVDTVGALMVYARWPRPRFDRLDVLWRDRSAASWGTMLAVLACRVLGWSIAALALLAPMLEQYRFRWTHLKRIFAFNNYNNLNRAGASFSADPDLAGRRDMRLWGLWCVCTGYFAVYLPVHIETRYVAPVVPLACVLAAAVMRPPPGTRRGAPPWHAPGGG